MVALLEQWGKTLQMTKKLDNEAWQYISVQGKSSWQTEIMQTLMFVELKKFSARIV